jgi:hypothetical protein
VQEDAVSRLDISGPVSTVQPKAIPLVRLCRQLAGAGLLPLATPLTGRHVPISTRISPKMVRGFYLRDLS